MKKYGIDPLVSQTEHDATTSQAQKILCCIEVCMNSNHGKDAVDILAAYKLQNPDPNQWQLASNPADVGTRNLLVATLLEGLVESNYVKEARKLFDLLYTAQKCVKKPIDIAKHLNTLLVFLLDANLNVEALNLFLKINQPALPVEVVTYRALLAACVEKHMMKAAETLWRSLGLFGVFSFQEVTYPLVIKMKSYFMKEEIYMELRQYFLQLSKSLSPDQIDANDTECRVNILIEGSGGHETSTSINISEDLQEKENNDDPRFTLPAEINPVPTIQNNKTADQISRQIAAILVTGSPHKNKIMADQLKKKPMKIKKREIGEKRQFALQNKSGTTLPNLSTSQRGRIHDFISEDLQEKENNDDPRFTLSAEINLVPTIQNNKTADQISRQGAAVLVTGSPHKNKIMDDQLKKKPTKIKKREIGEKRQFALQNKSGTTLPNPSTSQRAELLSSPSTYESGLASYIRELDSVIFHHTRSTTSMSKLPTLIKHCIIYNKFVKASFSGGDHFRQMWRVHES
uniref:Uncharacterized protein n=1 Tax=Timema cristinae TaxID=61476 RepID=A0A7R9CXP1_TIMCR|nr:unnamed protein product [Timema cristinae]